jgi:enoyl-CoA hydratase
MSDNGDVHIRIEGRVGRITLTRPQALNAINQPIVDAMSQALTAWESDVGIALVLVDAEGEKAFSAGGDLAWIYRCGRAGDVESPNRFWRWEYRLNALIARYRKPYVAIMDGIVMGGGVGISAHGSHRIVTEASMIAMPECGVGLITDVGGTWLLARAQGHLGAYLGLTGTRMTGADAIQAGFADLFVPRAQLAALKAEVVATGDVAALEPFAIEPPESALAGDRERIDRLFAGDTVPTILDGLRRDGSDWALKALATIEKGSPISAIMILWAIRNVPSLKAALTHEYRFVSRVLEHGDFLEGIRAVVIDKDRNPVWRYADIASVPADLIALFEREADGGDPDFNS